MSVDYELALRGLKSNEEYVETISRFVAGNIAGELEKNEDGYMFLSRVFNLYFDLKPENMDLPGLQDGYDFDADFALLLYFFNDYYEEAVDLVLKLVAHLDSLGLKYLFAEDGSEVFRKENDGLMIASMRTNWPYYLNEETIRRFLK